jgi:hypothetical protein
MLFFCDENPIENANESLKALKLDRNKLKTNFNRSTLFKLSGNGVSSAIRVGAKTIPWHYDEGQRWTRAWSER